MGDIGDPIVSGSIPAVGTSGTTYASQLNLFLTEVKNRLEAQVPKASLAPGPLDLDGEALQNASYLGLTSQLSAPTTPNNSFQAYNGEVYWVSAAGVAKLTDSGNLNAAGIGSITGDYGGVNPAQFRFVDADQEYYAYDNYSTGTWAYLWARGLDLAKDATSTTRIRVLAPSALASSYTLTLPDTPAATRLLKIDSSGNITSTQITRTIQLGTTAFSILQGATNSLANHRIDLDGAGAQNPVLWANLLVPVGATLTQVRMRVNKASDTDEILVVGVYKITDGTGALVGSAGTLDTNAPGLSTVSSATFSETTTANGSYAVRVLGNDANPSATDYFYWVEVDYTEAAP